MEIVLNSLFNNKEMRIADNQLLLLEPLPLKSQNLIQVNYFSRWDHVRVHDRFVWSVRELCGKRQRERNQNSYPKKKRVRRAKRRAGDRN